MGDARALAAHVDDAITRGSVSASIEVQDEVAIGDARMILRTYERFSALGGNRLTLSMSILAVDTTMEVALTTSGGSQAIFFKVNTFGEEDFMNQGRQALDTFSSL
jgi:hypothetical protein